MNCACMIIWNTSAYCVQCHVNIISIVNNKSNMTIITCCMYNRVSHWRLVAKFLFSLLGIIYWISWSQIKLGLRYPVDIKLLQNLYLFSTYSSSAAAHGKPCTWYHMGCMGGSSLARIQILCTPISWWGSWYYRCIIDRADLLCIIVYLCSCI